ncbi:MAG: extracellular solute-binding protein [Alphaproteobacteria bacterium]|nr:extracellular solute-binding protein [Alphaproteobacteria bacterium]
MKKLLLILLLLTFPAQAADNYGLAMHGTPKYTAADKHLSYASPTAQKGGTFKQKALGTFDSLNPFAIKGKAAEGLELTYDRLMARVWDEPFTLYPLIASAVEVPDDRSSITFTINKDAKFQDGNAITADDVIFSFETLKEQGRPNMRRVYQLVSEAKILDDGRVKFTLGDGYDRETVMILAIMPVLSKKYWEGKTFDSASLTPPVTSGPYKIAEVDPGRRITYKRDPDYWAKDLLTARGLYNFDQITYDYYRDDTVAFEAFKAGETDFRREMDAGKWAGAYDFPALISGAVVKEAIPHGRPERVNAFIFNTRRAPFDDIKVRAALNLAFDFEWANENLFHKAYKRINSYYPNSELAASGEPTPEELAILEPFKDSLSPAVFGPAYQPPVSNETTRRVNLRKASDLLKEAGWDVKDGVRQKDGKPLTFEILLSAPEDEKLALHFIRSLERLGIKARPRVLDAANYRGRLNEYDFDMTLYYWLSSLSPGTEQVLYWGCQVAKEPARWNFAGICNPAVDAIAAAIPEAKTREGLVAHVHALDRILTHGQYMIPLYYKGTDNVAFKKDIKHPVETPLYGMVIETWWKEQGAE